MIGPRGEKRRDNPIAKGGPPSRAWLPGKPRKSMSIEIPTKAGILAALSKGHGRTEQTHDFDQRVCAPSDRESER